jgi:phytoene/squalene synthetase
MSDGMDYTYPTGFKLPTLFVCCVMRSKIEIYRANATQCEARAQEMPPGLRREFLAMAEHWRKIAKLAANAADAADHRKKPTDVS